MLACTDYNSPEKREVPAVINPNGDSELALLMRDMFEDGMRLKEQIAKGEQPDILK